MLSKNKMVKNAFLGAVKRLYEDVCTVYVIEKSEGRDGSSEFSRRVLFEEIPCRISYDSIGYAKQKGSTERTRFTRKNLIPAAEISCVVRLFVEPQFCIPAGSEICVFREFGCEYFRASGEAAVYSSHREIILIPAEKFV